MPAEPPKPDVDVSISAWANAGTSSSLMVVAVLGAVIFFQQGICGCAGHIARHQSGRLIGCRVSVGNASFCGDRGLRQLTLMDIDLVIDEETEREEENGDDCHSQLGFTTDGIGSGSGRLQGRQQFPSHFAALSFADRLRGSAALRPGSFHGCFCQNLPSLVSFECVLDDSIFQ